MKKGKRYVDALKLIDRSKAYGVNEALELVKKTSNTKFDASVDVAFRLNVDPKYAEQQIRGAIVLPHGTGKTKKVLAVTNNIKAAEEAGADYVGGKEMLDKIVRENWFDFDVIVATPDMMGELGKLGRVLGPKGLMPNPKTGTVTMDTKKAVEEVKKGRVEYRADTYGNIHVLVGKVSFDAKALEENITSFVALMAKLKPAVVKGTYIKNISIASTMGPGVKIDVNSFDI